MFSSSQGIQLFLSKFHPNRQLANKLDWQKQVRFQIHNFRSCEDSELKFSGLFQIIEWCKRANFEEI